MIFQSQWLLKASKSWDNRKFYPIGFQSNWLKNTSSRIWVFLFSFWYSIKKLMRMALKVMKLKCVTADTRVDSSTKSHLLSLTSPTIKIPQSAEKMMAIVFWELKGVLLADFISYCLTVNAFSYSEMLDRLKKGAHWKKTEHLCKATILMHKNVTSHRTNLAKEWLKQYGWNILLHPPHSPDLTFIWHPQMIFTWEYFPHKWCCQKSFYVTMGQMLQSWWCLCRIVA